MKTKYKVLFFTIFLILVNVLALAYNNISANTINSEEKACCYLAKEYVGEGINVDVSDEAVEYLLDVGIDVKDKPTIEGWIFKRTVHHYYYETNEYVNYKVSPEIIKCDIDSVIYMIKQLESYANIFKNMHKDNSMLAKKLVLGYIRSINTAYSNFAFNAVCNSYCEEFIRYVNDQEYNRFPKNDGRVSVTIPGFFASFIPLNRVNSEYKAEFIDGFKIKRFELNFDDGFKEFYDPLNSGKKIDIIHMFCSVDGCYNPGSITRGYSYQDVISWAGDLQTAAIDVHKGNIPIKEFVDVLKEEELSCPWADLLADIDGFNISENYLKYDENSLSESISAYYNKINDKNIFEGEARYKLFLKTIGKTGGCMDYNGMKEFKTRIGYTFGIDPVHLNEIISDRPDPYKAIYISKLIGYEGTTDMHTSYILANAFYKFICESAGYTNYQQVTGYRRTFNY